MLDHDPASEADGIDPRPWERPGAVRRDAEPHRGPLIYRLGGAAFFCGTLSVAGLPALVALALAAVTWTMARHDLGEMAAGRKDPAGRGLTAHGLSMARGAVALALVGLAAGAGFLLFMYLKDSTR